jgi:hypothetical protein
LHPRAEEGQHSGIDPVGLGQPPQGAGEVPHLARIDDGHREAGRRERGGDRRFVASGRFEHDEGDRLGLTVPD